MYSAALYGARSCADEHRFAAFSDASTADVIDSRHRQIVTKIHRHQAIKFTIRSRLH